MALQKIKGSIFESTDNGLSFNVKDYGAKGDGSTDDYAAIQATIDAAHVDGGEVYFPPGDYRVSATLKLDQRGITGAPNSNTRRVDFRGAGKGNTILQATTDSTNVLRIIGDNPLTSASHAYMTVSHLAFGGASPTSRTCNGLRLDDLSYLTVTECTFHNLGVGLLLSGVLSSHFDGLIFNESTRGVYALKSASGPHANFWAGCEFRFCTKFGYEGDTTTCNATFIGCQFEACGTMGDIDTGGADFVLNGSAGEAGPCFIGCYFELNRNLDIRVQEIASVRTPVTVMNCNFNRISNTSYSDNNIRTAGSVNLSLIGNSFTSYNTYVPDASRPYLDTSPVTKVVDVNNRWEDPVEQPQINQGVPYFGEFTCGVASGLIDSETLPPGWTASKISAGLWKIVHNLGHVDYSCVATLGSGDNLNLQRTVKNSNEVQFRVSNLSGTAVDPVSVDYDVSFMIGDTKPRS